MPMSDDSSRLNVTRAHSFYNYDDVFKHLLSCMYSRLFMCFSLKFFNRCSRALINTRKKLKDAKRPGDDKTVRDEEEQGRDGIDVESRRRRQD